MLPIRPAISPSRLFLMGLAALAACAPKSASEGVTEAQTQNITISQPGPAISPSQPNATTLNPNVAANPNVVAAKAVPWPSLDFVNNPAANDPKAVALSFDDGPDGVGSPEGRAGRTNTSYMLDQLKALDLKATFFICGNKFADVKKDALAQADIKRIVAEGHALGSHTFTHDTLDAKVLTTAMAAKQISDNQALLDFVLGPNTFRMSLYRAPYGIPFQTTIADVPVFAPAFKTAGVHVGWGIDPQDWLCAQNKQTSSCILNTISRYLDKGASGVILMHSVYKLSAETLPAVVDLIKAKGYHIVMVEDLVKAKYGANSIDIAKANDAANFDDDTIRNAAIAGTKISKWYLGTNE